MTGLASTGVHASARGVSPRVYGNVIVAVSIGGVFLPTCGRGGGRLVGDRGPADRKGPGFSPFTFHFSLLAMPLSAPLACS
ncbi:MAG: hypothetical protein ABI679_11970 [Gemmatimonadota bacterium]